MAHLTDVSVEDLQQALDDVEGSKPAQRLMAAIAYKHGVTQSALADWFDVERKTIYNWLTRLEQQDLESAVRDERRPGRPRKLSADQFEAFERMLQESPREVGYDAPAWTTALVQACLSDRFDVEYSRPSCRRLMKEAGLRHRTARTAADKVGSVERKASGPESELGGHLWTPQ